MAQRTTERAQERRERTRIGSRLQYHRHKAGLSLRQLATLSDISPSTLCRLESGMYLLSVNRLLTLSRILGCEPGEVLTDMARNEENGHGQDA